MHFDSIDNVSGTTNLDNNIQSTSISTAQLGDQIGASCLSNSTSTMTKSRRSVRLARKSPRRIRSTSTRSTIHRTLSGGVNRIQSTNLNSHVRPIIDEESSRIVSSVSNEMLNSDNQDPVTNTYQQVGIMEDSDSDVQLAANTILRSKSTELITRAEVLSYFTIAEQGYKCRLCGKIYRANKNSDSNLRKHLGTSIHRVPNVLFNSQNNTDKSKSSNLSFERQHLLHEAAVDCILKDGLPFGIFRKPGMINFIHTAVPGYLGPDRKTVRKRISKLYAYHVEKLKSILPKLGPLALTSDIWRSSQRVYYLSLTCHFLNENYESQSIVLSSRRFSGRHWSNNIAQYLEFELNRLNIRPEQVVSITTDNGSDIKKATSTSKFGYRISCMAHNLNLIVQNGLCQWKEPNINNFPFDINNENDHDNDQSEVGDHIASPDEDDAVDIAHDIIEDEDGYSNQSDLVSEEEHGKVDDDDEYDDNDSEHDISLSILSMNNNNLFYDDYYELLMNVFQLMKKVRAMIKFIRNHNIINEYFTKCARENNNNRFSSGLLLDMSIRWNSSYLMLDRLFVHRQIVTNIMMFPNKFPGLTSKQKKKLHDLVILEKEWDLIENLRQVLEPFQVATNALSTQQYPTMSISFFVWRSLSTFLQPSTNDLPVISSFKSCLRYRFEMYCQKKLPPGQWELMIMGAFLDPVIYNLLDDDDRQSAKRAIYQKLKNMNCAYFPSSSTLTIETVTTTTRKVDPLQKLAAICHRVSSSTTSTTTNRTVTIDEELSEYIKAAQSANNFQKFWSDHDKYLPRLSTLVRRINAIPSTSVASESLFSVASYLNRKHRSSLSSQTLRYLLVLKDRSIVENLESNN